MNASSVPGPVSSGSFGPTVGRVAGAVLAGGRSSRMGATKAFARLAGRPLLAHVLDRLRPQTARVYLNARDDSNRWRAFGCPLVEDASEWRGAGPLAGIAAALARAAAEGFTWLATAPCDAPFLPLDLVAKVAAAGRIEAALAGQAGPSRVLQEMGAARVSFGSSAEADPFANLNTPEELAAAEALFHQPVRP